MWYTCGMRKDSENEADRLAELKAVRQVTLGGMAVNVALSALKAASGWLAGSQALLADAVHSASDLMTDFAVLLGVRYWTAPADEEHPYGHGKIQAVVAAAIGLALAAVAIGIGRTAVLQLLAAADGAESPAPAAFAFWIAVVSLIAKEVISVGPVPWREGSVPPPWRPMPGTTEATRSVPFRLPWRSRFRILRRHSHGWTPWARLSSPCSS